MTFVRRNAGRLPSYMKPGLRGPADASYCLLSTGYGYLNRITKVKPDRSAPYFVVQITALSGDSKAVKKRRFEAKASNLEARTSVQCLVADVASGKKVFIHFRMTDLSNPNAIGEHFQTSLIAIDSAKVDGQDVSLYHRQAA